MTAHTHTRLSALALTTAAVLTGCSTAGHAVPAAEPVPATSAPVIDGVWVGRRPAPLPAVSDGGADLDAAARLGMDRGRAASAARHGYPYVTAVDGRGRDCPLVLRMPDGALWWSPPMATVTGAGTAMTALSADAPVPAGCVTPSGPPAGGPVDAAAADAALAGGRPWISAEGVDHVDGCHVTIRLPGTAAPLGLDSGDAGKPGGSLVGGMSHMFACAWR